MSDRYDDAFDEMDQRRPRARRSRSGRTLPAILLLLACGVAAVVIRENFGELGALYQMAPVQPYRTASHDPDQQYPDRARQAMSVPQTSVASAQPMDELRQMVKDLGASLQQTMDKLEVTQRQLAAEQGERQLLSEQVGALSARVSALSASNASVAAPAPAAPLLPKKKPLAPIAR